MLAVQEMVACEESWSSDSVQEAGTELEGQTRQLLTEHVRSVGGSHDAEGVGGEVVD